MRRAIPWILAAALAGGGCPAARSSEGRDTDYAPVIAEMRGFLSGEMARLQIPCLSIALVDGERIVWQEGFGFQDKGAKIRATEKTVYRVGSISKLLTAVAVLQLEERKLVDITAPITRHVPEVTFRNRFNPEVPITLRHLVSHRAGILRESPVGSYFDPTEPGIEPTVRSIIGTDLIYAVGARTKYSNLGPTVAGYIIEKMTKTPFVGHMNRNILGPAGMTSSSFLPDRDVIQKNLAVAFMVDFDGSYFPAPTFSLGTLPAGNLYSTVGDLARFMILLFKGGAGEGGRVLSPQAVRRAFTVQFPDKDPATGFGLGFFVSRFGGRKVVRHSGAVYGFASAFVALPEERIGVVVLNNVDVANGFNEKVVRKALTMMLNRKLDAGLPPLREPIDLGGRSLDEYAGKYTAPRRDAWVTADGGELRMRVLGVEQLLRPIAEDRFLSDGRLGYGVEFEFLRGADRRVAGVKAEGVEYRRVPGYRASDEVPETLKRFTGEYGWPHNIMKVYAKDGRLTCLVEWFFEYPLEPVGGSTFAFPDYGLYEGERVEFVEGDDGRVIEARMASVAFKRL